MRGDRCVFHKVLERTGMVLLMLLALLLTTPPLFAQTFLIADGVTEPPDHTYSLIRNVLAPGGNPIEVPDCSHPEFGPHITQAFDSDLGKYVFVFHIHVTPLPSAGSPPDNDRCINFDRQRNEIKTYDKSPDYLLGFCGDAVTFRWKFRLDACFQASPHFTHIHQIKPFDGDATGDPIISLTPRAPRDGSPHRLELIHVDSARTKTELARADLSLFKGVWVEAYEKITYRGPSCDPPDDLNGTYSITLTNLMSGTVLLFYSSDNIDMWRNGTTIVRPKWGIYRSLQEYEQFLRNEEVRFDRFCLAKGADDCPK
jgi:hypothetical protein